MNKKFWKEKKLKCECCLMSLSIVLYCLPFENPAQLLNHLLFSSLFWQKQRILLGRPIYDIFLQFVKNPDQAKNPRNSSYHWKISVVFQAAAKNIFSAAHAQFKLPLRLRKVAKVWSGGARETHWATCHNGMTPSKTKESLKSPGFF